MTASGLFGAACSTAAGQLVPAASKPWLRTRWPHCRLQHPLSPATLVISALSRRPARSTPSRLRRASPCSPPRRSMPSEQWCPSPTSMRPLFTPRGCSDHCAHLPRGPRPARPRRARLQPQDPPGLDTIQVSGSGQAFKVVNGNSSVVCKHHMLMRTSSTSSTRPCSKSSTTTPPTAYLPHHRAGAAIGTTMPQAARRCSYSHRGWSEAAVRIPRRSAVSLMDGVENPSRAGPPK